MEKIVAPTQIVERTTLDELVTTCNEKIKENALTDYVRAKSALEEKLAEYNSVLKMEHYAAITSRDNPLESIVLDDEYEIEKVKENRTDDGVLETIEIEKKNTRVNLVDFCKKAKVDLTWFDVLEIVKRQIALLDTVKLSKAESKKEQIAAMLAAVKDNELYKAIYKFGQEDGAPNPISNTQIQKNLKKAVAMYLGKEESDVKVLGCDVQHLSTVIVYDKKNKNHKTVNNNDLIRMFMDVLKRVIKDKAYSATTVKGNAFTDKQLEALGIKQDTEPAKAKGTVAPSEKDTITADEAPMPEVAEEIPAEPTAEEATNSEKKSHKKAK